FLAPPHLSPFVFSFPSSPGSVESPCLRDVELPTPRGVHAGNDDAVSPYAPAFAGASGEDFPKCRNRLQPTGQLDPPLHLWADGATGEPPHQRPAGFGSQAGRSRRQPDVESLRPPGSLLRCSLRRRGHAHAEPAAAS